jgi:hypothetical protein
MHILENPPPPPPGEISADVFGEKILKGEDKKGSNLN